jgi:hypothetical protein
MEARRVSRRGGPDLDGLRQLMARNANEPIDSGGLLAFADVLESVADQCRQLAAVLIVEEMAAES